MLVSPSLPVGADRRLSKGYFHRHWVKAHFELCSRLMTPNGFKEFKDGTRKNPSTQGGLEKIAYENQKADEMYQTRSTHYEKRSAGNILAG